MDPGTNAVLAGHLRALQTWNTLIIHCWRSSPCDLSLYRVIPNGTKFSAMTCNWPMVFACQVLTCHSCTLKSQQASLSQRMKTYVDVTVNTHTFIELHQRSCGELQSSVHSKPKLQHWLLHWHNTDLCHPLSLFKIQLLSLRLREAQRHSAWRGK